MIDYEMEAKIENAKIRKYVASGVLLFVALMLFFNSVGTVGAGQRGIKTRFGAVTSGALEEGLYVKTPFIEKVRKFDIKVQKIEGTANAASKDLQTVTSVVALNFHVEPSSVTRLYQEVGVEYQERIIAPALQEAVKASTAKFTAEELITQRELVKEEVKRYLRDRVESRGIVVDEFNIVNFDFSASFNEAIENKVTAEQNALAAQNKLSQVEFEAKQRIAEANGKAEALRVEANALRDNPQVLELRALEKWDGVLPQVTGESIPFVNITK